MRPMKESQALCSPSKRLGSLVFSWLGGRLARFLLLRAFIIVRHGRRGLRLFGRLWRSSHGGPGRWASELPVGTQAMSRHGCAAGVSVWGEGVWGYERARSSGGPEKCVDSIHDFTHRDRYAM